MKVVINIPSYKRGKNLDSFKIFKKAFYWVHQFEVDDYLENNEGISIKVLPDSIRGNIARVRNYILEHTKEWDVSVQIDDDISKIGMYVNRESLSLNEEEILLFIKKYSVLCNDFGFKLWGINVNGD